jgi:flagellar M-ring protein FliF
MDLAQLLARMRAASGSFSAAQIALAAVVFVLVVGGLVGGSYVTAPSYSLLFADMDPAAASEVVDHLKTQKVPYKLDDGGRAIRVPEDKVDELRLALTAQGLPSTGRVGFEIFDRTAFGQTEFLEHINYRRALEGEIARTISTIGQVESARVHIAMAKESLFETREQPAKASVILKLKGSQPLSAATAASIANLVSSSVEGLRPDGVVILDNFGRSLTRGPEPEDASALGLEHQQRIEHDLSARVVSLLEPIVGTGRVRVNVAARLNAESHDETEEHFDPETVVRSHQTTNDTQQSGGGQLSLAGARANVVDPVSSATTTGSQEQPPPQTAAASLPFTGPAMSRTAEVTNYEISKTVRHSVVPRGELARLWVAVLVDDDVQVKPGADGKPERSAKPRTPEELQKIQGLVSAAVGLDQDRGDQLTVENIAFDATPQAEEIGTEATPRSVTSIPRPLWIWIGAAAGGVLLLLVGVVFFVRMGKAGPAVAAGANRKAVPNAPEMPAVTGLPKTVQDLQNDIEAQLDAEVASATGAQKLPALARRVGQLAGKEPEAVALLVRSWMAEDRR